MLWSVPVLLMVSVLAFGILSLLPGGPYSMSRIRGSTQEGRIVPPQIRANIEARYGLDRPVWQQYLTYMKHLVLHFDFGPSLWRLDRTVNDIVFGRSYLRNAVRERFPEALGVVPHLATFVEPPRFFDSRAAVVRADGTPLGTIDITSGDRLRAVGRFLHSAPVMISAQVGTLAAALALVVGIPLGVLSALKQNSWIDYLALLLSMLGISVPSFVLGIALILFFALKLEWLPTYGWGDDWRQVILPVVTLSTGGWPVIARLTRASVLEVLCADYVRTARAKGLRERVVVLRHVLKNAMLPVTTVMGPLLASWLTGAFVVESVFSIGGIGKLLVSATAARDYPLIMGIVLLYAVALIFFNLLADVGYGIVDPRIRVT
jgi:ABC-type dipeptide/oligopeptide/nickel transport system permease component